MAAGDIQQRSSGMNDIQNLLAIFKGGPTTTVTSTSKEDVSTEKANAYIKSILESTQGLAQVSMGEKSAGMYNTSTGQLLSNDLLARTAAQAAALSSSKTNTQTSRTGAQASLGKTLAVSGLKYLASPGPKGNFSNAKNAYNYMDKFINGGGNTTVIASPDVADVFADGQSGLTTTSSLNYGDVLDNTNINSSGAADASSFGAATDLGASAIASLFGDSAGAVGATGGGYVVGSEGAVWGSAMGADAAGVGASEIGAAAGTEGVSAAVGEAAGAGAAEGAGGFAAGAEALGLFGLGYTALNSILSSRETTHYFNPKTSAYYARMDQAGRDKWDAEYDAAIASGLPGLPSVY